MPRGKKGDSSAGTSKKPRALRKTVQKADPAAHQDTGLLENLEDEIRQRAYELWEESGCQGSSDQHWLQAEREVLEKRGRSA